MLPWLKYKPLCIKILCKYPFTWCLSPLQIQRRFDIILPGLMQIFLAWQDIPVQWFHSSLLKFYCFLLNYIGYDKYHRAAYGRSCWQEYLNNKLDGILHIANIDEGTMYAFTFRRKAKCLRLCLTVHSIWRHHHKPSVSPIYSLCTGLHVYNAPMLSPHWFVFPYGLPLSIDIIDRSFELL